MQSNVGRMGEVWRQRYLAEGRAQGRIEGNADALVCVLVARFGTVEPSLRERIHGAKLPTLNRWFKRAIVASDLPSVFDPPR